MKTLCESKVILSYVLFFKRIRMVLSFFFDRQKAIRLSYTILRSYQKERTMENNSRDGQCLVGIIVTIVVRCRIADASTIAMEGASL